jgi:hypothetical protein
MKGRSQGSKIMLVITITIQDKSEKLGLLLALSMSLVLYCRMCFVLLMYRYLQ